LTIGGNLETIPFKIILNLLSIPIFKKDFLEISKGYLSAEN
jgi:hypothetical protein